MYRLLRGSFVWDIVCILIIVCHVCVCGYGKAVACVCDVCGKTLCNKWSLRAHQVVHNGVKPFACGSCPKRFKWVGVLFAYVW